MRALRGLGVLAVIVVAALAVSRTAGAQGPGGAPGTTLAANRAAARADARAMLAQVTLPAGATALPTPAGPAPPITVTPVAARVQRRWRVAGVSFSHALAEVESHRPADVVATATESSADRSGVTSRSVLYTLRNVEPSEVDERTLKVTAAPAARGSTLTVESESVWVVPRSTASMIPAATRMITLVVTSPTGRAVRSARLSARRAVIGAVEFFNRLAAAQPFVISCPLMLTGDTITLRFLSRPRDRPLAQASWAEAIGGDAGQCAPIGLRVRQHEQDALVDPNYLSSLERIFRVRLPAPKRLRAPAGS